MATKNIKRDILKILREFNIAGKLSNAGDIKNSKEYASAVGTRVLTATFSQIQYFIIIDNKLDDDIIKAKELIDAISPHIVGKFVKNPKEDSFETYGVRHKFHETYLFEVEPRTVRLDKELALRFRQFSRSTLQKYIKEGYVYVDEVAVKKPSSAILSTAEISLNIPPTSQSSVQAPPILYIDDSIIVINKPAGMLTHSKGALNEEYTVADFFRSYTTDALDTNRPGIVHRLDRGTSGVLVGARNSEAAVFLKKQFANRTVKKTYLALVDGQPKLESAKIDVPIARNPSSPSTFKPDVKGKLALTNYRVIKTSGLRTLIELNPKTGRTHQLRVHLRHIGTPIVGDYIYGKSKPGQRMFLHAASLELTLPGGKRATYLAPLPPEFDEL